ncbi:hypothetical protein AGMMS49983_17990 [Clostridia bacterium]|nr:hypothetical protein AGMMS49983_17990 [Clostridia bacterium]
MFDNQNERNYNITTNGILFEWDPRKNLLNMKKHRVTFDEAITVFFDDCYLEIDDPDHSDDEERFLALGLSSKSRLLLVCHCFIQDDHTIRIISARKATTSEAKQYGDLTNAKRI